MTFHRCHPLAFTLALVAGIAAHGPASAAIPAAASTGQSESEPSETVARPRSRRAEERPAPPSPRAVTEAPRPAAPATEPWQPRTRIPPSREPAIAPDPRPARGELAGTRPTRPFDSSPVEPPHRATRPAATPRRDEPAATSGRPPREADTESRWAKPGWVPPAPERPARPVRDRPASPPDAQAERQRQRELDLRQAREQQWQDRQPRLPAQQQQVMIREAQQQVAGFERQSAQREASARHAFTRLGQQQRHSQHRCQQDYYWRLLDLLRRFHHYGYYRDPYYYSAPIYGYYRQGHYYRVNRYAADVLRQALDFGYQEGFRAGEADWYDGWAFDYRGAYAYQDANFGYYGYYVRQAEYNYYFREGFRRGYEDGYYGRRRYGYHHGGNDRLLSHVLYAILDLQFLRY